jgi:acyl-coenzyme A synthetase/AMP-(fatty) acid ligase
VVADVVLADGCGSEHGNAVRDEILSDCRTSLAPHKVPAIIRFVPSLDMTAAGKLARNDA